MNNYITATKVSVEEFMNKYGIAYEEYLFIKSPRIRAKHKFTVIGEDGNEYELKTKSLRYKLFYRERDNLRCVDCGIEGKYFLLQKDEYQEADNYHANLYGIDEEGNEILMTKDHIIRSKEGGKDHIDNMQIMCWYCNCVVKQ